MSKIIFLNGCGSSGKTRVAQAIQDLSKDLWLSFGVDTFIDLMPKIRQEEYLQFIPGENDRGPLMNILIKPIAENLFNLMPKFASMLASAGNNLIIDEVLFDDRNLQNYMQHLKDHTVYYIGVYCDLQVMQEREIARGDRCIGLSNAQLDQVHLGARNNYDFFVDTSYMTQFEAAKQIIEFVENNSP